tara:strand:- start:5985 stop:6194 length:210 start_codon:yes stop_codon:yes gene_type:complete
MKNNCDPDWKKFCIACCSSQLWILPALLLGVLILIESVHTEGHRKMEVDVHGHCMKFLRNNPSAYSEDN